MTIALRWTPEQLDEFLKRRKTHVGPQPSRLERVTPMLGVDIDAIHRKLELGGERESKIERRFTQQLTDAGVTGYQRNYFFLPDRELELDYAWTAPRIAVEVQGMAHRIKGKFTRDIEKRALALLAGWRVLEVDGKSIRDGRAIAWLKQLLEGDAVGQVCRRDGA